MTNYEFTEYGVEKYDNETCLSLMTTELYFLFKWT